LHFHRNYCSANRIYTHPVAGLWLGCFSLLILPMAARGQTLRLGPVDIEIAAGLESIYTTNVDDVRPSATTKQQEDFYFVASLDLDGNAELGQSTTIDISTALEVEKHLNRPDLDTSETPFCEISLAASTKIRRSTLTADVSFKREDEISDEYVVGGRTKKAANNEYDYGVGWAWDWRTVQADASYSYEHTRYDDEEYQDGDSDKTTVDFNVSWQFAKRLSLEYSYERTLDDYVLFTEKNNGWQVKSLVDVRWQVSDKPDFSVYVGYTKDTEKAGNEDWYPTYGADFSTVLLDTKKWTFDVAASWEYVKDIEADSDTTFSANLENQLSRTAKQSLTAEKKPVGTFGSNQDTDETTVEYRFDKDDLFIYNLNFTAGAEWKEDVPVKDGDVIADQPTEHTWTYDVGLEHNRALTRKLLRELRITYEAEDSNLYDEWLTEFRVELEFIYTF